MPELNETHDPTLTSWIDSANEAEADFPVQNLPLRRVHGSQDRCRQSRYRNRR